MPKHEFSKNVCLENICSVVQKVTDVNPIDMNYDNTQHVLNIQVSCRGEKTTEHLTETFEIFSCHSAHTSLHFTQIVMLKMTLYW